jgi:hypothetical protein
VFRELGRQRRHWRIAATRSATGYYAQEKNLLDGVDLDTQEWSRIPIGRAFGAAGANFSLGRGPFDVFGEFAYTYDKSPDPVGPIEGGGGPGAVIRITHTQKRQEIEGVFATTDRSRESVSRPISQADGLDGSATCEVGGPFATKSDKLYSICSAIDV